MIKRIIIILVITMLVILFGILLVIQREKIYIQQVNRNVIKIDYNDNLEHKRLIYEMIELISYSVAQGHDYKIHKFDCTDFSKELKSRLIEKGLNAYCVFGIMKGSSYPLHTWVEIRINEINFIWVESTSGDIIESENKDNYKLLSKTKVCI